VRWETEWPFDGQLYREYVHQKLLKLDNLSSSYGYKILVCFYASQCRETAVSRWRGCRVVAAGVTYVFVPPPPPPPPVYFL